MSLRNPGRQERWFVRPPLQILPWRVLLTVCLGLAGCYRVSDESIPRLTTAVLQDRNGFSETISQRDRLARLEDHDFRGPQSYQKVIRVFARGEDGEIPSILTTYHPNGQLHHWLEVSNGRALGRYEQRYPDGRLRMEATIVGGVADLTETAMTTWQFDGECRVYDPAGNLQATIPYKAGALDGVERRFHANGQLARVRHFSRGVAEGPEEEWSETGQPLLVSHLQRGRLHGTLQRWDLSGTLLDVETWSDGHLVEGDYRGLESLSIDAQMPGVRSGRGWRIDRSHRTGIQLVEIQDGLEKGWTRSFSPNGRLDREWEQLGGEKHGIERVYDAKGTNLKLEMHWVEGSLCGPCKSFYPNGCVESSWEMLDNQRHGRMVAWYRNGAIMLLEEYDRGKLLKGEYFELGRTQPISRVNQGNGVATLHQGDGRLIRSVTIQDGEPAP